MWEGLFWGSCALVAHAYGGYLVVLVVLDAIVRLRANARWLAGGPDRRARVTDPLPRVSVLVAAHDEEAWIRRKIDNTLALEYPPDRLEILVGSDGSTDATDAIVASYEGRGVGLSTGKRSGKAAVLNRLTARARGEVFLLTDANTMLEPGALKHLVARFADERVGAVCGRLKLVPPAGGPATEGAYWAFENLLRLYEGAHGAVVGANGGLWAIRRVDWEPLPAGTIVDDFLASMRVVLRGRRVVYAPEAVAVEETAPDLAGEFRRRVRIAGGNLQSIRELAPILWRADVAALAFWSHKILRWLGPALLAVALASNVVLAWDSLPWRAVLAVQLVPYGLAAAARWGDGGGRVGAAARWFVEMNAALAVGWWRFLRGGQAGIWQRTARAESPARRPAA